MRIARAVLRGRSCFGARPWCRPAPCLLAAGVLPLALAAACARETPPPEKPPRPVQVAIVQRARAVQAARYSATIIPASQVPVAFKASGYVDTLLQVRGADRRGRDLQQGDIVRRGDRLARVQQTDYRARVQQADARVAQATAAATKAKQDLDRAEQLFAVRSLTQPDLDAARAQHDAARAQLTAARADVDLAHSALRDTDLVAPLAGVVLEKRIERGTLAGPGSVAFVLGDVRSVKALFGVPDTIVRTLMPGAALSLVSDALPGRQFTGRITTISPAADTQSRVFGVEVTIPNTDGALKPGMIATVQVDEAAKGASSSREAVMTVPLTAIVKSPAGSGGPGAAASTSAAASTHASSSSAPSGAAAPAGADSVSAASAGTLSGYAVFIVERSSEKEIARARVVTVGDVVGNEIEVAGGLRDGDRVITTGATLIKDGDIVRVIP